MADKTKNSSSLYTFDIS